jgi:electron transport complex protein RnfA
MDSGGYLALIVGAILVNNFVLSRFLGICPFLGVSRQIKTSVGMSGAVLFVMTLATFVTSVIYNTLLVPDALLAESSLPLLGTVAKADLGYLRTIVFILVIASLVQLVELSMQKLSPPLYKALGIYLPLITTNCAVLGAAVLCSDNNYPVLKSTVFGAASAVGFAVAIILFASLREKLDLAQVPKCLEGTAIALVTAGILAMVFMGFAGMGG